MLFSKIAGLIELARRTVAATVNLTMVHTYFEVGRLIVEEEQQGKERAEYGKKVLKNLPVAGCLCDLPLTRRIFTAETEKEIAYDK